MRLDASSRTARVYSLHRVLHARGFTLIELLTVLGIISLLLAILLPTLSRAREQSRRTKCAANLHNLGIVCHAFADEHKGYFPMCYKMPDVSFPYRFPIVVSQDDRLDQDFKLWQAYGTSFPCFTAYGMQNESWHCPDVNPIRFLDPANGCPPEWGVCVWTDYMYVGGMTTANVGKSTAHWTAAGTATPAVRSNENDLVDKILAADTVFYTGGPGNKWDTVQYRYLINHPNHTQGFLPDFQNILHGDGHVDALTASDYRWALNTSTNYSLRHAGGGVGGYLYWGEQPPAPPPPPAPPVPPSPPVPPPPPRPPVPPPVTPNPIPAG
jgi:prepilin-type N-terminal cleavage/methylation domain-containing protein